MKGLHEKIEQLVQQLQMTADSLGDYNPGLCKDKIPLETIQYDLACLGRELTWIYSELGRKIKNDNNDL